MVNGPETGSRNKGSSKKEDPIPSITGIGRSRVCECMFLGAMSVETFKKKCMYFQKIGRCSNPDK